MEKNFIPHKLDTRGIPASFNSILLKNSGLKNACLFFIILTFFFFSSFGSVHAVAVFRGKILKINPASRLASIQLPDGSTMNFRFIPDASFLKLRANVELSSFGSGENVIIRASGALNDDPVNAEMMTDQMSAPQEQFGGALMPGSGVMGGTATCAGPSPDMGPQATLIYPSVQGGVPGSTLIPPNPNMPGMMGSQQGSAPSPMGSPYTAESISSGQASPYSQSMSPGGQASSFGQQSGSMSLMTGDDTEGSSSPPGIQQLNQSAAVGSIVQFDGKIVNIMADKSIVVVQHLSKQELYYVQVVKITSLSNRMTGSLLKFKDLKVGQTVTVAGMGKGQSMVEARAIMVQSN
ncbi:MAG: hypothetical protein M1269_01540 [Chloroflexi bacterium]|nr:hypothetical protein [Chloroflexota bacterium]